MKTNLLSLTYQLSFSFGCQLNTKLQNSIRTKLKYGYNKTSAASNNQLQRNYDQFSCEPGDDRNNRNKMKIFLSVDSDTSNIIIMKQSVNNYIILLNQCGFDEVTIGNNV